MAELDLERVVQDVVASTSAKAGLDGVYLIRADQIVAESVDYLDDGLIPTRVVTLVTGVDGVGKSTMLCTKAAQATRGDLPGAFVGTPIDVVIASSEDHPGSVIWPRLVAANADLKRVHVIKSRRDGIEGDVALPDDLPAIGERVRAVGARLLIVDPLIAHMPLGVDTYKAQHVRSVLAPLAHLAEEAGLAIAAVVHFNGGTSTDVRTRISGSKALRDASRSVLVCDVDPKDESRFLMVQDKHSFGPRLDLGYPYRILEATVESESGDLKTSKLVWDDPIVADSRSMLAGPEPTEDRLNGDDARDELDASVRAGGGKIRATEAYAIGKAFGVSEKTMQRKRRDLKLKSTSVGFGIDKVYWWHEPDISLLDTDPHGEASSKGVSTKQNPLITTDPGGSGSLGGHALEAVQQGPSSGDRTTSGEGESCKRCDRPATSITIHGPVCDECSVITAHGGGLKPPSGWPIELEEEGAS